MKFSLKKSTNTNSAEQRRNPLLKKSQSNTKNTESDKEIADVYAEFVRSFEPGPPTTMTTSNFVHGGSLDPNSQTHKRSSTRTKHVFTKFQRPAMSHSRSHNPLSPSRAAAGVKLPTKLTRRDLNRLKKEMAAKTAKKKKKGREIDAIRAEIEAAKAQQQAEGIVPSAVAVPELAAASGSNGYDKSTNLYVGNLPMDICETQLSQIFGRYGPIGSVKIMWPRTAEEKHRDRLCGFVSYMRRDDAERSLLALKDSSLFGERLRVGWGKPVAVPGSSGFNPSQAERDLEERQRAEAQLPPGCVRFDIRLPTDLILRRVINRTAIHVAKFGVAFEDKVRAKEGNNARFKFLVDQKDPNHYYYRWRVYSMSMGDSLYQWRTIPFQIIHNGPFWIPPPVPVMPDFTLETMVAKETHEKRARYSEGNRIEPLKIETSPVNSAVTNMNTTAISRHEPSPRGDRERERERSRERERERDRDRRDRHRDRERERDRHRETDLHPRRVRLPERPLSERDRDKFMALLRQLSQQRYRVKEAMIFCLDHSNQATEVAEILTEALTLVDTAPAKKLARLFLVSDILCNCNTLKVKNAAAYRTEFRKRLSAIFESLRECHQKCESRYRAQEMERDVYKVLSVWDVISTFPTFVTRDLRDIFSGEAEKHRQAQKLKDEELKRIQKEQDEKLLAQKKKQRIEDAKKKIEQKTADDEKTLAPVFQRLSEMNAAMKKQQEARARFAKSGFPPSMIQHATLPPSPAAPPYAQPHPTSHTQPLRAPQHLVHPSHHMPPLPPPQQPPMPHPHMYPPQLAPPQPMHPPHQPPPPVGNPHTSYYPPQMPPHHAQHPPYGMHHPPHPPPMYPPPNGYPGGPMMRPPPPGMMPMMGGNDIDGIPMDDIDGEPMD